MKKLNKGLKNISKVSVEMCDLQKKSHVAIEELVKKSKKEGG